MKQRQTDSGNALWVILIAIVLLAALTMMLSRSSDTSSDTGDYEQRSIQGSKVLRYAAGIELAVNNLKTRGCSENSLSFWHDSDGNGTEDAGDTYYNASAPTDHSCHIFEPEGAGQVYEAGWNFLGETRVLGLGSDSRIELLAEYSGLSQIQCTQINNMIGIANSGTDAPSEDYNQTEFTGTYGTATTNGDTIGNTSAWLAGQTQSCTKDGAGDYFFNHVLIAR
ncbi:MAG: hypothetical protein H6853_09105 [Rhodospirillales bacterium]|nr:hypothetical protein [Alphaproteobacteria bacterium]USO03659.1 MAG: hypothetical protein H6853_09105 [Rhodospirillales bacterium]